MITSPFGEYTGLYAHPSTSRTGAPPSSGILNSPGDVPSLPAATIEDPSGDQSAALCPTTPWISIDGARVRELVPSADMMASCRFPGCRPTIAMRLPSGDTTG